MYFPQVHPPGREAQFDFTHCGELKVTIAGQSYPHLLFQLILSHSGWRYAEVAAGETFLALQQGLQNALWTLGGVPEVVRSDNTAAATHELRSSRGRALNDNYAALLDHYGLRSTRINPGQSHENGVAEHAHYRLKDAIDQALILRGSRDFDTADDYASFVRQMVERRNRLVEGKLEQELLCLRSLPPAPVPEYVNYQSKVRKWCTIQVAGHSYSVPSRLIGKEVQIRLYADWVEVYYKGHLVERMERVRGEGALLARPGARPRSRCRSTSSGRPRCRPSVAGRISPAFATRRWSSKEIWMRSGWLRGSILGALGLGSVFCFKTIIPDAQSTFLLLQEADPTHSFGGFGLRKMEQGVRKDGCTYIGRTAPASVGNRKRFR